jgi:hypothetical protein
MASRSRTLHERTGPPVAPASGCCVCQKGFGEMSWGVLPPIRAKSVPDATNNPRLLRELGFALL